VPEHLQDEGFHVGQRAAVRQPRSPLPPDGLVCGRSRGGSGLGSALTREVLTPEEARSWTHLVLPGSSSGCRGTRRRTRGSRTRQSSQCQSLDGHKKRHLVTKRTGERVFTEPITLDVCLGAVSLLAITKKPSGSGHCSRGHPRAQQQLQTPKHGQALNPTAPAPPPALQPQGFTLRNVLTCPKEVVDDADDLLIGERDVGILPCTILLAVLDQRVRDVPDVLLGKSQWVRDIMDTQGWGNISSPSPCQPLGGLTAAWRAPGSFPGQRWGDKGVSSSPHCQAGSI